MGHHTEVLYWCSCFVPPPPRLLPTLQMFTNVYFFTAESTVQQMKKVIFKLDVPCSALCTNRDGTLLAAVGRRGKGSNIVHDCKKKGWTTGKNCQHFYFYVNNGSCW